MKPPETTLLGIDSATRGCAAAVLRGEQVLAEQSQPMDRGQAEALMPMIEKILKDACLRPEHLDCICVTYGPGAFTGLRIALAAARGMALALNVPCIGVTTFEAVAQGALESAAPDAPETLLVVIESKRDDVYAQLFSVNANTATPASDMFAADAAKLAELVASVDGPVEVVGDGAPRAFELFEQHLNGAGLEMDARVRLSTAPALPSGAVICRLGAQRFDPDTDSPPPQPLYLRPPDAKLPAAGGRLRP